MTVQRDHEPVPSRTLDAPEVTSGYTIWSQINVDEVFLGAGSARGCSSEEPL